MQRIVLGCALALAAANFAQHITPAELALMNDIGGECSAVPAIGKS